MRTRAEHTARGVMTKYNEAFTAVMLIMASVHAAGAMGFGGTLGLSTKNDRDATKSMWHTFSAHPPVNAPPPDPSSPTPGHTRMLNQSLHCALYGLYVSLLMNDDDGGVDHDQTISDKAALRYCLEMASAALLLRYVGRWRGLWWTSNRRGPDMYCTSIALSAVAFWLYLSVFALRDTMEYRGLVLKSAAVGWLGMASLQHTDLPAAWFGRKPKAADNAHTEAGRSMIDYIKTDGKMDTYIAVKKTEKDEEPMPPWPTQKKPDDNDPGIGVMKS